LPGAFLLQRVGSSGTNLSVSDLLVFLGAVVALLNVDWKAAPHLRRFLVGVVVYEVILIVVVAFHPNRDDVIEWLHRFSDLGGSAIIGWVIAAHRRVRQALRLYLLGAAIIAVLAMEHAVAQHFLPAQWGLYQKNAVGGMMWPAILLTQLKPEWTELSNRTARTVECLCVGGLLASQSRQSALVLIGVLGAAFLLRPDIRRQFKLVIFAVIGLGIALYFSFAAELKNSPKFSSVAIRVDQLSAALKVWHMSPILGEGLRFYNLHPFVSVTAPPNVMIDALASSGIVGLVALLVLMVTTVSEMARLPRQFGLLGLLILVGHYVDGLFDIFWIGASLAGPFIIAGICLGLSDRAMADGTTARSASDQRGRRDRLRVSRDATVHDKDHLVRSGSARYSSQT
jgi:hypothetical protein